jgi:prevent-host-death family protein
MKTVTLSQAKTKLQALLRLVAAGEEVEIVENRRPVARLVPPPPDTVSWGETFTKLEAIWGKEPLPGVPGSEIVSQGRRWGCTLIRAC